MIKQNVIYKYPETNNPQGLEFKYCLKGKVLYVNFYGSDDKKDWINNFIVGKRIHRWGMRIQENWFRNAETAMKFLMERVFGTCTVSEVHLVGISAGGTIAAICGEYLRNMTKYKYDTICYGAPRAFNVVIDNCLNFANRGDIVPLLPFWNKPTGVVCWDGKFTLNFIKAHSEYSLSSYTKINWL